MLKERDFKIDDFRCKKTTNRQLSWEICRGHYSATQEAAGTSLKDGYQAFKLGRIDHGPFLYLSLENECYGIDFSIALTKKKSTVWQNMFSPLKSVQIGLWG